MNKYPRNKPETGQSVEFQYDRHWYPGTYDDSVDWPQPVWLTARGVVVPGTDAVACSVAKRWRNPRMQ